MQFSNSICSEGGKLNLIKFLSDQCPVGREPCHITMSASNADSPVTAGGELKTNVVLHRALRCCRGLILFLVLAVPILLLRTWHLKPSAALDWWGVGVVAVMSIVVWVLSERYAWGTDQVAEGALAQIRGDRLFVRLKNRAIQTIPLGGVKRVSLAPQENEYAPLILHMPNSQRFVVHVLTTQENGHQIIKIANGHLQCTVEP